MNNQTGINVESIKKLCLEIQDYSDKIKETLNQIGDAWYGVKPYFEGDGLKEFQSKFSTLENSFETISENISSYIDEFNALTSKYETFDVNLSRQIIVNAENVEWKEG